MWVKSTFDKITKKYYVIEIKRDEADGKTLGQLLQYMGWVHKEFIPNGVIICRHISSQYNFAENFFCTQTKNSIKFKQFFMIFQTIIFHQFKSVIVKCDSKIYLYLNQ